MNQAFITKLESAGGLSADDRKLLAGVLDDVRPVRAKRDIISEGDSPDYVHLMVEGWASRYKILHDGSRQITAFLIPGDFCDTHIQLFGSMDHSIGAITDGKVAYISRATMNDLTDRPAIVRAFWWASLVDEAVLRAWVVNLGRRDALDRVAHLICELYARLRNVGLTTDGTFTLPLTQEEIGDSLGLTSIHVNRTLRRLHEANLMTSKNKQIIIRDMDALQKMAGFDPNYLHLADTKGAPAPALAEMNTAG